ncbi:formate dehydrogenase subunit delta [Herbaspirillum sp. alder98]|uniref:formate dehydrogenase subunit delta n=1 Tax=Herbaspirillum sp. alder98 TaxID=2913096 RepID=UPI001CD89B4E|nr:formate dehydrogenase subunit delta [Herbaspirillum sp. alder98]MCA1324634.1 formate dehydrogenase subunit delta [Herbaspirillum sp. alder98]
MNAANLIKMANQIGSFFSTMPDHEQAVADLAAHIKRFWEPRMRRALLAHVEQTQGAGLSPIVLEALERHAGLLAA